MPQPAACPCGGCPAGAAFTRCCGRYLGHFDELPAPDAERLMRSRYSAFVLADAAYLLATWHASTRPASLGLEPGIRWLGLSVRAHRVVDSDRAEVEFVARSRLHGRASRLHERSRFVHEQHGGIARWYYVDGDLL